MIRSHLAYASLFATSVLLASRDVRAQGECQANVAWNFETLSIQAFPDTGAYDKSACEPLVLSLSGLDEHGVIHNCGGCAVARSYQPVLVNVSYSWQLNGQGRFVENPGGASVPGGGGRQQVMYEIPTDLGSDPIDIEIVGRVHHADSVQGPDHAPAVAVWNIRVNRAFREETFNYSPTLKVVKETAFVHYEVDLQTQSVDGTPPPDDIASACLPVLSWEVLTPISGALVDAGPLLNDDFVYLRASYSDSDQLKAKCEPDQIQCAAGNTAQMDVSDLVSYEWECLGATFPAGNSGRDVVLLTPRTGATIQVKLTVSNGGLRYEDTPVTVITNYSLEQTYRTAQAAAIGWVNPDNPAVANMPLDGETPPQCPTQPHQWKAPEIWPSSILVQPLFLCLLSSWNLAHSVPYTNHPWKIPCEAVRGSGNPSPQPSYSSLDELRTWMGQRQYRTVLAFQATAAVRRNKITDIRYAYDQMIADAGYTPAAFFDRVAVLLIAFTWTEPFEPGIFRNRVLRFVDVCGEDTQIILEHQIRLGEAFSEVNRRTTNRDAPWLGATLTWNIQPSVVPAFAHFSLAAAQHFPTFRLYWSNGTGALSGGTNIESSKTIEAINLGRKVDYDGL